MKAQILSIAVIISSFFILPPAFGQGALTPPGAPAPTMKTLDQVQPRTPVDSLHTPGDAISDFKISLPGSYYLTTNIVSVSGKAIILLTNNDITLDLNGFAIIGNGGGSGVATPINLTNLVVRNGTIQNCFDGIDTTGNDNTLVENVLVTHNAGAGISVGPDSTVRNCKALSNTNTFFGGIYAEDRCVVTDCTSDGNGSDGIFAMTRVTIEHCVTQNNKSDGIHVGGDSVIIDNHSSANTGDGIFTSGSGSRIEGNQTRDNTSHGINSSGGPGADVIIRNTAGGNTAGNYTPITGATFAPIQSPATMTNAWGNISF